MTIQPNRYLLNFAQQNQYNTGAPQPPYYESSSHNPWNLCGNQPQHPIRAEFGFKARINLNQLNQLLQSYIPFLKSMGSYAPNPIPPFPTGPDTIGYTMKAPSDNEDGGSGDYIGGNPGDMFTMKAPSDSEDGGSGGQIGDLLIGVPGIGLTLKAPSDSEDGGTVKVGLPPLPTGPVTMKAPSDNEDGGELITGLPPMMTTMKFPSDGEDGGSIT